MGSRYQFYRAIKKTALVAVALFLLAALFLVSITSLSDPASTYLRQHTEIYINGYLESLMNKADQNKLSISDRGILHIGCLGGIIVGWFAYPEASALLFHYVYGDGSDFEVSASYFRNSPYLQGEILQRGIGSHGPIPLRQHEDWRLSLAFNPYYLKITSSDVRLFHPHIAFAPLDGPRIATILPIGKLRLRLYDNLVTALHPTPFYGFAEWSQ